MNGSGMIQIRLECPSCLKVRTEWTPVSGGLKCPKRGQFVNGRNISEGDQSRLRQAVVRRFAERTSQMGARA